MKYDAIKKKAGRKNRYVLYCVKRYVQIQVFETEKSEFDGMKARNNYGDIYF